MLRYQNTAHSVDDIEDNSKLRRGVPVAHSIYGVASTINAANYVYFQVRITTAAWPEEAVRFWDEVERWSGSSLYVLR